VVADDSNSDRAQVRLVLTDAGFELRRTTDGRLITSPVDDPTAAGGRRVIRQLEHVARWSRLRDLDNPASALRPDQLRVEVSDATASAGTQPAGELRVTYQPDGTKPRIRIRVTNDGDRPLFVSVLGLDDRYSVVSLLRDTWGEWLQPGQDLQARAGNPVPMSVDDALYAVGITEVADIVKVIASTHDFAAEALGQGGLDTPTTRSMPEPRVVSSSLDRLLRRVGSRSFDDDPVDEVADWLAVSRTVVVHRPRPGTEVTEAGATIADGLHLTVPSGVTLTARVAEVDAAARAAGTPSLPALLREASAPVPLTPTRALGDDTSVLELFEVQGVEEVTAQTPMLVRVPETLASDEHLLPVAWDGEYWLPVGRTTARSEGATEVAVETIPPPVGTEGERDLLGSMRILFRKVVGRKLGLGYSWPRLAVARADPDGTVTYDVDAVPAAVASAQRVLLYLHGIIGDTRGMVRHGTVNGLHEVYDAVLAFDYENLDTKVIDTAAELARLLREAGFRAGGGPRLDVVAHSMGGLVARWYVEHEDGHEVVDRLVLAGTPHGGSPWPQVQDWASTALGVGLNALGGSGFWPANILGGLVSLAEKYDTALDDMKAGSSFLGDLARQADPQLPYHVLAGERSATDDRTAGLVRRLRLRVWRAVEVLAFLREPNDIAVAVASATALPSGRDPEPRVRRVGCDHMTYFSADAGVAALRAALDA
jgi:pimeloyl-ACP methyl ester carboxylesterase